MLKQEYRPAGKEEQAVMCRHHWLIEPASGPISHGKCRTCGVEKEFKNYLEEMPWVDYGSSSRSGVKDVLASITIPEDEEGMD